MVDTRIDLFDEARAQPTMASRRREGRRAATRLAELLRAAPAVRVRVRRLGTEPVDTHACFGTALRRGPRWWTGERRALEVTLPSGARALLDAALPRAWAFTPIGARYVEARARRSRTLLADARELDDAPELELLVFTSLRGQSLSGLLGTTRGDGVAAPREPRFPKARALVGAAAWREALDPDPRESSRLVREDRTIVRAPELLTHDVLVDHSLALISMPGRAPGQLSAFMHVELDGRSRVLVWSANGVALDAWDPHASTLPGFEAAAREEGREVVTGEDALCRAEQELSMAIERVAADWHPEHPAMHLIATPLALNAGLFHSPRHALR